MAISKDKKNELMKQYIQDLSSASNIVVLKQEKVSVNNANKLRKDIRSANGRYNVIRKRLFLKALKETGCDDITLEKLEWSVVVLYDNSWEQCDSLKAVNKNLKLFKKEDKWTSLTFLWGWFDKKRQSAEYVGELASLPSKEELISKLLYLLKYPLQSLACVVDQVSKKLDSWVTQEVAESTKVEAVVESVVEENAEWQVEEVKTEDESPVS